jgi:hypothetical protein
METLSIIPERDDDPLVTFRATGEKLPPELRERILALGEAMVPRLVEILADEDLGLEDAPGDGWPPIHAVDLLADLRAVDAAAPMLRVLARTSWDEIVHDRLVMRLPELGAAVLEPALAELGRSTDPDLHGSFCAVLAKLGVRDERIYAELCALFEEDEIAGAVCFGDYGDERALALLQRAIREFQADDESPVGVMGLADLVDAHERIAGALPADLRALVDRLRSEWSERFQKKFVQPPRAASAKVGRNDPCPCGSGRKYKKCCLLNAPPL